MNESQSNKLSQRALVLGGGGATGNAWLIGVIAGLSVAGVDVTTADVIIGTSAGATAAAQITSTALPALFAATVAPPVQRLGPVGARPGAAGGATQSHLDRFQAIIAASKDASEMRRTMGAIALENSSAAEDSAGTRWRDIVAARLPGVQWPKQRLVITTVDARSGEPVEFDNDSGVDLVDAVAASTSGGGAAYPVGGGWYIDGGYRRSSENADLAIGYGRVLVLSPLGGKSLYPPAWNMDLASQVHELRAAGSRVESVIPDVASEHLFGANAMDFTLRQQAAEVGFEQGGSLAEKVGEFLR